MTRSLLLTAIAVVSSAGSAARAETPPPETPAPPRLAVGTSGFFRPGLLMQGWFVLDRSKATSSAFRVRRAELSVKGDVIPGLVAYGLMIDPAKVLEPQDEIIEVSGQEPPPATPGVVVVSQPVSLMSVLQDFYLTVASSRADVTFGQIKIPVGWEGFGPSAKLLFPERALVSREFGDKRDIGLRIAKTFSRFGYSAGVFNGTGPNAVEDDNDKDVALRIEGYPVEGLLIAGVVYSTIGRRDVNAKDRYEGDVRFERGPLVVQAEYIRARDVANASPARDSQGFYGAVAWTLLDVLQPCVRVGRLDPDVHAKAAPGEREAVWHFDAGLNYYLRKNEAKMQLSYSRFEFERASALNEVILAAQVSY